MYQFIHVESYSRSTPKKASSINKKTKKASPKSSGQNVKYIVDEAIREVDSIPHIDNPMPPTYVYGEPLEKLEDTCNEWASSMKDARGHAMRKDALCLLAGVVSAPNEITPEAWQSFEKDSVEWLKKKYGPALRTVIAHHDESHPHLHFYVVPEAGKRFETIHQGRAASAESKAIGEVKGIQNQAYKDAMRQYQDEFYDAVGIEHGFTRIGPGKRRLTIEEAKLEKIQAAAAAHSIKVAHEKVQISEAEAAKILEAAQGGAEGIKSEAMTAAEALKSDAEGIKSEAMTTAEALKLATEAERASVIEQAKSEAREIARKTLEKADEIEREAAQKGFNTGLDQIEKLPWFKRVKAVIGRAVGQRDELKEQLTKVTAERDDLASKSKTWASKAMRYLKIGKTMESRVKELEPALSSAERKALEVERLKEKNESLTDDLSRARGRIQHLEAVYVTSEPETPEIEPERARKPKKEHESSLDM
tara:strand:- start:1007 stop:2437 length:1431 start_codon:yes stop_codon:yes gene_type:complete